MKSISKYQRFGLFTFILGLLAFGNSVMAADWVTIADGVITFAPSNLVTPVATAAVAAAVAAAVLIVLAVGVRWCYKLIKGSK